MYSQQQQQQQDDGQQLPPPQEEEADCLKLLGERMQSAFIHRLPNWEFTSWLTGPQGFTALLPEKRVFNSDMFLTGEKYRVIALAEVHLGGDHAAGGVGSWTQDRARGAQRLLKRCLPQTCPSPPSIRDQKGSGFNFSLGSRGSSLGLYKTLDGDLTSNDSLERWFLVCHTCLPDETIHEMQQYDDHLRYQNMKATGELEHLEEGLHRLPNQGLKPGKGEKLVTYGMAFGTQSVNERMRSVAEEHAKRLLHYVSLLLDLPLVATERKINRSMEGKGENNLVGELHPEGQAYRQEGVQTQKYLSNLGSDTHKLLWEALEWWPPCAPIPVFHCLPDRKGYSDEDLPPKHLAGYPLGPILHWVKEKDEEQFERLKEEFDLVLLEQPCSFNLDLLTDYNTFRVNSQGDVKWYSNCTPTDYSPRGIVTMLPYTMGYEVIRPNFMESRRGGGGKQQGGGGGGSSESSFDNSFSHSYPCVFPWIQENKLTLNNSNVNKFIWMHKQKGEVNKQLMGKFNMSSMVDKGVDRGLNAKKDKYKSQLLQPVMVYLSEEPFMKIFEDYIFEHNLK